MRIQVAVKVYSLTVVDHSGAIHNSLWLSPEETASELSAFIGCDVEALDTANLDVVKEAANDVGLDFDVNVETLDYDTHP
jgi:hypothetical protein